MENKKIRVIKCKQLNLIGKDMIELENMEDFIHINNNDLVFEFEGHLYTLSSDVGYFIKEQEGE